MGPVSVYILQAAYHGVPVVALPYLITQKDNAAKMVTKVILRSPDTAAAAFLCLRELAVSQIHY